MLSDIEIAQGCQMRPITEVAAAAGLDADDLELYGKYKAKLSADVWTKVKDKENGKLVLVTAINPTPAGEGKTTTSVGLGQALCKQGKNAIIALREPSLGPVFGIKGGAAGGGYAQVVPMEDINLHFTGDMHAITAANNLLCAMLDNHMQQGNVLGIDPRRIVFTRVMDMNDRALRNITIGLGGKVNGVPREDHFMITVASEVMAILCLAKDMNDLKERLGNILIAYTYAGHTGTITVPQPRMQLAVGTLQTFLDAYLKEHGGEVDYIHGDAVADELGSKPGNIGFKLPAMGKEQLFKTVMADGVLPRKTFSMGHAQDKRYYIEARKIVK